MEIQITDDDLYQIYQLIRTSKNEHMTDVKLIFIAMCLHPFSRYAKISDCFYCLELIDNAHCTRPEHSKLLVYPNKSMNNYLLDIANILNDKFDCDININLVLNFLQLKGVPYFQYKKQKLVHKIEYQFFESKGKSFIYTRRVSMGSLFLSCSIIEKMFELNLISKERHNIGTQIMIDVIPYKILCYYEEEGPIFLKQIKGKCDKLYDATQINQTRLDKDPYKDRLLRIRAKEQMVYKLINDFKNDIKKLSK